VGELVAMAAGAFLLAWFATSRVTRWLVANAILDHPNQRSSHAAPTPRGGGIGFLAGLVPAWAVLALAGPAALRPALLAVLAGGIGLAVVSFMDDRRGLPVIVRLGAQLAAVSLGLAALPDDQLIAQGQLPLWADRLASGLAWLWFVNLVNFMDGIDGISGVEAVAIGLGAALVGWATGAGAPLGLGLTLAAAAGAFLCFNWHPAKVFLGDVGSVPLGYLGGWLLLALAAGGAWAAALILPAYYLADATVTLLRRLARGERIWQAHRQHYYQAAVRQGMSHAAVARRVALLNAALVGLAFLSTQGLAWPALGLAALAVAARLAAFARPSLPCGRGSSKRPGS
jgi:UDP-N-acetylmuramyl pentapeptide phosphotransferase/UDP-N-acetylglucosamine-1-phosphate transferase